MMSAWPSQAIPTAGGGAGLLIEGLGLRYRRGGPWALRNVTLGFPAGSVTALVGPNGAGKSTLIRACLAFERPDEGRVLVFGSDPSRDPDSVLGRVGYVPQVPSLYRALTVSDHLTMALAARPTFDGARALTMLTRARLDPARRVQELSGGETAKIALALAIGANAALLLLDEPLASLDPLARREFLQLLADDVHERGTTVVLSSHIVTDIEQVCDRLVVLGGGRVLLESPIQEATRRFTTGVASATHVARVIGRFTGPNGVMLALVDGGNGGSPAHLEEIVLGHLASERAKPD